MIEEKDFQEIKTSLEIRVNEQNAQTFVIRIFIQISDNGKGIDKEIENKVFLPFFTTRKEGAGIGLTLSKNIVEAHGGYLDFRNQNEKITFV